MITKTKEGRDILKVVGLIAEFNPFHNGHAYLIEQIKKQHHADIIICVMSGHFLQRGEPAIIDKWSRAKIACLNGVDIVIELPYTASVQPSDIFATAAITILNNCHISHLAFGCENNNLHTLLSQAQLIQQSEQQIYSYMQQGDNYAQATKKVIPQLILSPNNILALSYLKAINAINHKIEPIAIQRLASQYHDIVPQHDTIASATAIRHLLYNNQPIEQYVPKEGYDILVNQPHSFLEMYWPALKTILARATAEELRQMYDIREGLEYRLLKYWQQATNLAHFISLVKTKRYSSARIQRCCCHILTNTQQQFINNYNTNHYHILALNHIGRSYLKTLKNNTTEMNFHTNINQKNSHFFAHDIRVTQVYDSPQSTGLNDFIKQPFINKNDD